MTGLERVTYVRKGDTFSVNAFGVNLVLGGRPWVEPRWEATAEMLQKLRKENPDVEFVESGVTFNEKNFDRVPAPRRAAYQDIIRQAIERSRPADEHWTVTTSEPIDSTVVRFDFARGTEAPHGFTFSPEGDDETHTELFRTACQFLQTNWPGGRQAR